MQKSAFILITGNSLSDSMSISDIHTIKTNLILNDPASCLGIISTWWTRTTRVSASPGPVSTSVRSSRAWSTSTKKESSTETSNQKTCC